MEKNIIDIPLVKAKEKDEIKYYYSFGNIIKGNLSNKNEKKIQDYLKKKNNFLIKNIYKYNFSILVLIIIYIYIPAFLSKNKIFRKLDFSSEITLTIKGSGTQKLLSDSFSPAPENIIINGNIVSYGVKEIEINSGQEETNVTLRWTSELTTCQRMFTSLNNIIHVDLTGFVPLNIEDMSFMFAEYKNIKTIEIGNFNSPNLKDMNNMFNGCQSLKSIDFKNIDTQQVTSMENMFLDCLSLTSIGLSNFNTRSVTNFKSMFCNCPELTSLDISNFYTDSAVYMNGMFKLCIKLKYLNIDNFNTNNVEESEDLFYECNELISLDASKFNNMAKNKNMKKMFLGCRTLKFRFK